MPSLRSSASSAPRSDVASAASAAFSSRIFSDAENRRRLFGGVLYTEAPLTARSRCLRSLSEEGISGSKIGDGLGTFEEPFSARRYRDIQRELSHATLAQRGPLRWTPLFGPRRAVAKVEPASRSSLVSYKQLNIGSLFFVPPSQSSMEGITPAARQRGGARGGDWQLGDAPVDGMHRRHAALCAPR